MAAYNRLIDTAKQASEQDEEIMNKQDISQNVMKYGVKKSVESRYKSLLAKVQYNGQ